MARAGEKAVKRFGFDMAIAAIGIGGLIGLIGGILCGVWDGFAVIIGHATRPVTLSDMFYLPLYSVALYAAIGFVAMVAIGAVTFGVIRVGGYRVDRPRLTGILIGLFVLLAVYVLLPKGTNWVQYVEFTAFSALSGLALASLSVYILRRGLRGERLAAFGISLLVWVSVSLYGVLWINSSLWPYDGFWQPKSLFAKIGFLLAAGLLAAGIYRLVLFISRKYDARRVRQAGWVLLGVMACVAIALAVVGPLGFKSSPKAEAQVPLPIMGNETAATPRQVTQLKGRPNILWIVMDTVREDHLSCYGYSRNTTPNIDEIASEGVLFENVISAAPWTLPSHASMFTSMFPSEHGTDAEHPWLDDSFETIAELLHSLGYQTYGYSNSPFVGPQYNLDQGFDTFVMTPFGRTQQEPKPEPTLPDFLRVKKYMEDLLHTQGATAEGAVTDKGAEKTNKVVEGWIADANQADKPFFLFINYFEAHEPANAPKQFSTPYLPPGVSWARANAVNQDFYLYVSEKVPMSKEDFAILSSLYDGEISYVDYRMGQLFDYVRNLGIMDNTVLIITSDHGQNLGEHNLIGHQLSIHDTLLRVPLIIRYPKVFEAGQRVEEQVQLTDIFPTITDIIRFYRHDGQPIRGNSLLTAGQQTEPGFAVAEYEIFATVLESLTKANPQFDASKYAHRLKAIIAGDFKYIWASDGRDELYNLKDDPGELNNLIDSNTQKASEMKSLLVEWLKSFQPYRPDAVQQLEE